MWELFLAMGAALAVGLWALKYVIAILGEAAWWGYDRYADWQIAKVRARFEEMGYEGERARLDATDYVTNTKPKQRELIDRYMAEGKPYARAKVLATYDLNKAILKKAKRR